MAHATQSARKDWWRAGPRAASAGVSDRLLLCLQVSRPGLWLVTVWVYLLPTGGPGTLAWRDSAFWVGLAHCTLPLNLLVYWWNDLGDFGTDATNPRKGGKWLGARASGAALSGLRSLVLGAQLPFALYYAAHPRLGLGWTAGWFGAVCAVNFAYNCEPVKLSSKNPPFDFIGPLGYLLVIPLSERLTGGPALPAAGWVHTVLLIFRTQLWTEIMDAPHDHAGGRVTTVLALAARGGGLWAPRLVLLLALALEFLFVLFFVGDVPLTAFAALSMGRCAHEWLAERRAVGARCGGAARGQKPGKGHASKQSIEALVAADVVAGGSYASGIEMNTTIILGVSGIALLCHVWVSGVLSGGGPAPSQPMT